MRVKIRRQHVGLQPSRSPEEHHAGEQDPVTDKLWSLSAPPPRAPDRDSQASIITTPQLPGGGSSRHVGIVSTRSHRQMATSEARSSCPCWHGSARSRTQSGSLVGVGPGTGLLLSGSTAARWSLIRRPPAQMRSEPKRIRERTNRGRNEHRVLSLRVPWCLALRGAVLDALVLARACRRSGCICAPWKRTEISWGRGRRRARRCNAAGSGVRGRSWRHRCRTRC